MARAQVREVSGPERIQGIASPVSTYVRPADPARSTLHELAEGLASFDTGLGSFMAQRKVESDEADKAKAIADFHRNNQVGYADAVREGLIPATASKSYVQWYKKQQGHLAGLKLQDKFSLDYQQWEGRDSDDPAAFARFTSDWMAANVGEDQDPDILAGLAPHLDRMATTGYDTFSAERAANLRSKAKATSGAIVTDTLIRSHDDAQAEGQVDYDTLWGNLMEQREEAISKGERGEDFDALIVESVVLQAEESGSVEMLNILDKTLPGQSTPMSRDPKVREAKLRATQRIENKQAQQATDLAQTREQLEKREHEERLAQAVSLLSEGKEVPDELITTLSRRDGEIRYKLAKYKKEYGELGEQEDSSALLDVYTEIDNGAGQAYVLEMREKGVIKTPETLIKALDRVKAIKKAAGDGGIFTSPTYKDTVKLITNATGAGEMAFLDGTKGLSSEGLEALYDYRNMLLDWEVKNPDATLLEKEKMAMEIGQLIQKRIVPTPGDTTAGNYISEADKAAQAAGEVPLEQPPVEPIPEEESSGFYNFVTQAPGAIMDWFTGDDEEQPAQPAPGAQPEASPDGAALSPAPALETLSEARRSAVDRLAKAKGLTPEEANQVLHERIQRLSGGNPGVDPTVTNSISPDTRSKLTSLLSDPPKVERLTASNVPVAPILNLVGHTEGTDKGDGYNETLGYGAYTGGDVDLVNMTLGEIDALQTEMLRHPNNKWNSSAIGRYQVIRTTLRDIKKELGLTDDMKFAPELQDQIAMRLLERRGLSRWLAGEISDEEFMTGLSAEWASLPKASGKGTYKGQRVGTSSSGVRTALSKVRDSSSKSKG